jgi:hypothetical protein
MSPILPGIVASGISGHLFTPEGSAYEIAKFVVPSATTMQAVTFTIPSGYRHFRIEGLLNTNGATNPIWTVNGDSSSTRKGHHMWGTGSAMAANDQSGQVYFGYNPSASYPSAFSMDWLDYNSTTKYKTMRGFAGSNTNGGTSEAAMWSGLYMSTDPIRSITLDGLGSQFSEYSTFTLIGYK